MPDFCFICRITVQPYEFSIRWRENIIECPVCSKYSISEYLATKDFNHPPPDKHLYSGAVRELNEKGIVPWIEDWRDVLDAVQVPKNPLDCVDKILLYAEKKITINNGSNLPFKDTDYSIGYASDIIHFRYFIGLGRDLGYFVETKNELNCNITAKGWERIIELSKNQLSSNQAFVAMSFDRELKDIWQNGLKPALEETGYDPVRMDIVEHNGRIDDQIIAEIRKSALLIADFTGQKAGVYFEAGLAMGIGIPVIWTCSELDIENIHFDTRQYNYVGWENAEELRQKLIHRIEAILPNRARKNKKYEV